MSVMLLCCVVVLFVVVASVAGLGVAIAVAGIPLEVLSRAAVGGRYAGLAAGDRTSPVGPSSGRRIPVRAAVRGVAA